MKTLEILEKVIDLNISHGLKLNPEVIHKVVANFKASRSAFSFDSEWLSAIDSVVHAQDPLKEEIHKKSLAAKTQMCPECGKAGELVYLMRNRPAYFCKEHNVASACSMDQIEEMGTDYKPVLK